MILVVWIQSSCLFSFVFLFQFYDSSTSLSNSHSTNRTFFFLFVHHYSRVCLSYLPLSIQSFSGHFQYFFLTVRLLTKNYAK